MSGLPKTLSCRERRRKIKSERTCPPSFPSVPTSRDTRVTSCASVVSCPTISFTVAEANEDHSARIVAESKRRRERTCELEVQNLSLNIDADNSSEISSGDGFSLQEQEEGIRVKSLSSRPKGGRKEEEDATYNQSDLSNLVRQVSGHFLSR